MKRRLLSACLALLTVISASAYRFSAPNGDNITIYYNINIDGTSVTVTNDGDAYLGSYAGNVVIPSSVAYNGTTYSVTAIGSGAFNACYKLTYVSIPESVTSIGAAAFMDCTLLPSIYIPTSITEIGSNPFRGCTNLSQFSGNYATVDGLALIKDGTLVSFTPSSASTYVIPATVTAIGQYAFYGCQKLTMVTIPNSVTSIGYSAFQGCKGLKSIVIPNSVVGIGDYSFQACSALESVKINSLATSIGLFSFQNCTALTSVRLPEYASLTKNCNPFDGCNNLSQFTGGMASEDNRCFISKYGNLISFARVGLTEYTIPEGVKSIGPRVFAGCDALKAVTLPLSVTSIGESSFENCTSLVSVNIPSGLQSFGDYAFANCTSLKSIEIPLAVTYIGKRAFRAASLETVKVYNSVPMDIEAAAPFDQASVGSCSLYVPNKDIYNSKPKWKEFQFIIGFTTKKVTEGTNYINNSAVTGATIYYTREFPTRGYYPFYIPYPMSFEDWAPFGDMYEVNNVHQYDTDNDGEYDRTTIEFAKITEGAIDEHMPCVFRPKLSYVGVPVTFVSPNCTLYAKPATAGSVDCSSTKLTYTMTGNYAKETIPASDNIYELNPVGRFTKITSSTEIPPYRFKLVVTQRTGGYDTPSPLQPEYISMSIDGEIVGDDDTTDIINIPTDRPQQQDDNYYDLMGRRVLNPRPGIYIHQGKKVYITK